MNDHLCLTYDRSSDGTGELRATVVADGFAGHGSAWFADERLLSFADSLLSFPLPAKGLSPLQGGYWGMGSPGELVQCHLSLQVYPVGHRGNIGCRVALRQPIAPAVQVPNSVEVELSVSYQSLLAFSATLKHLVLGEVQEAVLRHAAG